MIPSRAPAFVGPLVVAMVLWLGCAAMPVAAQSCAGFGDVIDDGPNGFCPSVQWLKNRGVTNGCGDGSYCPDAAVSRLAMAVFMKRLGDKLSIWSQSSAQSLPALDLTSPQHVCAIGFAPESYPRGSLLEAQLSARAAADLDLTVDIAYVLDGYPGWYVINAQPIRLSAPANRSASFFDTVEFDLPANLSRNLRLVVQRAQPGPGVQADVQCRLRVIPYSRTGANPPY